jgi:hypothetical protein
VVAQKFQDYELMKLLEVEICSANLEATANFYSGALGLDVVNKADRIIIKAGGSRLIFRIDKSSKPVYHFAFNIPPNQLNEGLQFIKQRAEIIQLPDRQEVADFSNWNAEAFYFFDNNGNILEFIARHDLNIKGKEKFSGASLLSISEIALVTSDVKATAAALQAETGITPYEKQPLLENFGALGDSDGLLILSAENRNWYPTEIPAFKFPCRVKCEQNGATHQLDS